MICVKKGRRMLKEEVRLRNNSKEERIKVTYADEGRT